MWCEDVVRVGGFGEVPTLIMNSNFIRQKKLPKAREELTVLAPVRVWLQEVKTKRTLGLDMAVLNR